ncbi:UNVERIFIED_CONTAM: hypothetical protein RF653_04395 [Kocuria sp. CPCC 205316]|uniref:hypothetical protein n=1 Tax=Kocuria TaxID=57493 RepID=UPI0036DC4428
MSSLTDLQGGVDVVIGVDTHVHTHCAAAVETGTSGVLGEIPVEATAEGYAQLAAFANEHARLRAWAAEGTGGHETGLTRFLAGDEELVVELDRPQRARRRHGAKPDPLDAIRAAREALARTRLGTPRHGGDRQALSVALPVRHAAVEVAADAQRQLFRLIIAVPEPVRARFSGRKLPRMLITAAALRMHFSWDVETTTTVTVLRSLARRARNSAQEAAEHEIPRHPRHPMIVPTTSRTTTPQRRPRSVSQPDRLVTHGMQDAPVRARALNGPAQGRGRLQVSVAASPARPSPRCGAGHRTPRRPRPCSATGAAALAVAGAALPSSH